MILQQTACIARDIGSWKSHEQAGQAQHVISVLKLCMGISAINVVLITAVQGIHLIILFEVTFCSLFRGSVLYVFGGVCRPCRM